MYRHQKQSKRSLPASPLMLSPLLAEFEEMSLALGFYTICYLLAVWPRTTHIYFLSLWFFIRLP